MKLIFGLFILLSLFFTGCAEKDSPGSTVKAKTTISPNSKGSDPSLDQLKLCTREELMDFSSLLKNCQSAQMSSAAKSVCIMSIDLFLKNHPNIECSIPREKPSGEPAAPYILTVELILNTREQLGLSSHASTSNQIDVFEVKSYEFLFSE